MRTFFLIFVVSLACNLAFTQSKAGPDSLFYRVFMLDSVWTTGMTKKTALKDSVSYFEIKGSRAEICIKTANSETREKGRIIYWRESKDENGFLRYAFYLSGRGAFKGSLTVNIKQISEVEFEIHILSAFATFDKRILARLGDESEISRPPKKKYKPGSK